jgi:hypothetical protein
MKLANKMKSKYFKACALVFIMSFSIIPAAYGAPTAPDWLMKAKGIIEEPINWLMWISMVGAPLLIAINGLKYKSANGNTQKMEDAMKGMKTTAIGGFIIFSASGIGTWFFSKLS